MDRITRSLLDTFVDENGLQSLEESQQFERFANYCVASKEYSDTFSIEDISCGEDADAGLDGIAIVVNGSLVATDDEVDDLCEINGYLEATFIFVQAKTSGKFNAGDIGTFCYGVRDFFSERPRLPRNELLERMANVQERIFKKSALMTRGKPNCRLYYVTTGKWLGDPILDGRIASEVQDIKDTLLFKDVTFHPVDADQLQSLYSDTKSKVTAEFTFTNKTLLPEIAGVSEAYLGVIPAEEYLRLIVDDSGSIRKSLFYDNVRDFQDYNDVNRDVRTTLQSELRDKFSILNNGVTVVAKALNTVGNRFHIEDYQIVNGCQTSHVLYNERQHLTPNVHVPIKVIATADDAITNAVIKATNRQTPVKAEELNALSDFQKKLETFYSTFEPRKRLFYERRSRQYTGIANIEKVRIVSMANQIRVFASMFLDEPHRAGRYYGTLLSLIGGRIFSSGHEPLPYYTSAFAHYKLEFFFRNAQLDSAYKQYRYHLLMVVRCRLAGAVMPPLSSRKVEAYCQRILETLWDDHTALKAYKEAIQIIARVTPKDADRDTVKTQAFTEKVRDAASKGRSA